MRTSNSIRNITTAFAGQSVGILITFAARIVFVRVLGAEYLGVNGLFTNILSVLALAEMGIGSAIIYSLYKPLAVRDEAKVAALMNFYARAYHRIGLFVLIAGLAVFPFLDFIIKDQPDVPHLNLIFLMFLANSVISYFFAYKRSLIIADQKNYIATIYRYGFHAVLNIAQVAILLLTRDFTLFLAAQILATLLENILVSRKADRLYPFLRNARGVKLDEESRRQIFKNVHALIYHRLGANVVVGTSNIVISTFVGIVWVGLYSNYYLVINAANIILGQVFTSMTASVGNLNALESRERSYSVFKSILCANFWCVGGISILLMVCFNPFIAVWLGNDYLLSRGVVFLLIVNFFIQGMRKTTLMFKDSYGLFWNDRYKPVAEVIINIAVSVPLTIRYGIIGAFMGTTISTMTTCFWIEPYVVYKHGFRRGLRDYFLRYGVYTMILVVAGVATYLACSFLEEVTIVNLIGKFALGFVIPNIIFYLALRRTDEFGHLSSVARGAVSRRRALRPEIGETDVLVGAQSGHEENT